MPLSLKLLRFTSLIAAMAIALAISASPSIRFEDRAIVVERLARGTSVAWFGIAHESQPYHLRVREYAGIETDADRDGTVRIELSRAISADSMWAVVDTTSGLSLVAQPDGGVVRLKPLRRPTFRRTGDIAQIAESEPYLKFWLVRLGRGAWVHTSEDGGSGDGDGLPDGTATANVRDFTPVADSPGPPFELQRGDIVITVDPWQLRIFETTVRDEDLQP
jgi:hypothetical protein